MGIKHPGFVHVLKLPLLNLRPHNRFVFVASFAILSLGAVGLDVLWNSAARRSRWLAVPTALLLLTAAFCSYRAIYLPEPLATELTALVQSGITTRDIPDASTVAEIQQNYRHYLTVNAGLCLIGLAGVIALIVRPTIQKRIAFVLVPFLCLELIRTGYDVNPQTDPALDYPDDSGVAKTCDVASRTRAGHRVSAAEAERDPRAAGTAWIRRY